MFHAEIGKLEALRKHEQIGDSGPRAHCTAKFVPAVLAALSRLFYLSTVTTLNNIVVMAVANVAAVAAQAAVITASKFHCHHHLCCALCRNRSQEAALTLDRLLLPRTRRNVLPATCTEGVGARAFCAADSAADQANAGTVPHGPEKCASHRLKQPLLLDRTSLGMPCNSRKMSAKYNLTSASRTTQNWRRQPACARLTLPSPPCSSWKDCAGMVNATQIRLPLPGEISAVMKYTRERGLSLVYTSIFRHSIQNNLFKAV
eukprot:2198693-Pleurochrysis_carterae.AAC.2